MMRELLARPRLPVHEWLAVVLIIVILAALVLIVQLQRSQEPEVVLGSPLYTTEQEIEIQIEGAVLNPGSYRFRRGALLREALAQAVVTADADLRRVSPDKRLRDGQVIHIKSRPMITVHVEGAVAAPGSLTIPKGTRLCDLIPLMQCLPEADLDKLRRQRKLRDGETIIVR